MRKLLFLLFIPFVTFGQSTDGVDICLALQSNNFTTDAEAERALTRIMNASGLAKNFALIPCDNISNAVAVSYRGERYIIYDKKFMSLISSRTNDWSNLTILAHEVGHHLNGHSIDLSMAKIVEPKSLAEKRKQELEADEFAGFIMAKLGAPLSSVLSSISLITTDDDDTFSTHPKRSRRLERLKLGYSKGQFEKSNNNSNDVKKKTSAVEKKVESKLGTTEGIWNLIDYSDDPFAKTKFSASIVGEGVGDLNIDKPKLTLNGAKSYTRDIITLENFNSLINAFLSDSDLSDSEVYNDYKKSLSDSEVYNDYKKSYFDKYDGYDVYLYFAFAVDDEMVGSTWVQLFEGDSDTLTAKISSYSALRNKNPINFPIKIPNKVELELFDIIDKLKQGKLLFIKVRNLEIIAHSMYKSLTEPRRQTIFNHYFDNMIFKFSLKGSSDALRWYN